MSGEQKVNTPSKYVKLNVGGSLHYTTIDTLTKHDTKLKAMFTGKMDVVPDSEGKKNIRNPIYLFLIAFSFLSY